MNRVTGCVLLMMLVSGCGTFNPHLRGDSKLATKMKAEVNVQKPSLSLDFAIKYADSAKDNYHNAIGNQARLSSWLGVGLIPIAAAATGLGITGGPAVAITALGLSGATGYGIGTWLTSKPSQRAWAAGYKWTSCAVDVMLPLLPIERTLGTSKAQDDFKMHIEAIGTNIDKVVSAISNLNVQLDKADKAANDKKLAENVEEAKAARAEAIAMIASARLAETKARELYVDVYTAGRRLKEAVDRISGQVSAALIENAPDLQALASIIGGLGPSYGQFIHIADSLKKTPPDKSKLRNGKTKNLVEVADLRGAITALNSTTETLNGSVTRVAGPVNMVVGRKPLETLKECGVSTEPIAIPMTIDPPGPINIDDGCTATTVYREIKGGASPYSVTLPATAASMTVRQTSLFGPAFFIETKGGKTGRVKTTIHATDRSGNNAFIDVNVEKCDANEKPTPPGKNNGQK